jgi:hypothetical protein
VREAQQLEGQSEARPRDLAPIEGSRGLIGRAVVGEDDLPLDPAVAKELGASPETLLDATRLVVGR